MRHRAQTQTSKTTMTKAVVAGAFGIGAAAAFPALAHAAEAPQQEAPAAGSSEIADTASQAATEGGIKVDSGSLKFELAGGAGAEAPGSVQLGSVGVSPNTGSDAVDNGSAKGEKPADDKKDDGTKTDDKKDEQKPADGSLDTGSLTEKLSGLSSGQTGDQPTEETGAAN